MLQTGEYDECETEGTQRGERKEQGGGRGMRHLAGNMDKANEVAMTAGELEGYWRR